tara:strand:+ start:252 stop:509 length:258 start_codon:yes stop_codon:yes gene_type:complete
VLPNYQRFATYRHEPNDDPDTYYTGPEVSGERYIITNPSWNEALSESKDRILSAEAYLESKFNCEEVRIEWNDQLSLHTFTTLNF